MNYTLVIIAIGLFVWYSNDPESFKGLINNVSNITLPLQGPDLKITTHARTLNGMRFGNFYIEILNKDESPNGVTITSLEVNNQPEEIEPTHLKMGESTSFGLKSNLEPIKVKVVTDKGVIEGKFGDLKKEE